MSTRAERRRLARLEAKRARADECGRIVPEGDYAITAGWFGTLADLEKAKRQSHDILVEMMGDRRSGPVHWRWWESGDGADEALRVLSEAAAPHELDHYRRVRAHLREYGGFVIVALAKGQPPEGTVVREGGDPLPK